MKKLTLVDSIVIAAVAVLGQFFPLGAIFRAFKLNTILPWWTFSYVMHGWYLAIPLVWFFLFRRRFAVGRFSLQAMRGWYEPALALLIISVLFHAAIYRPGMLGGPLREPSDLVAWLLFQGVWVGLTEEFLFRGAIQTGLANAFPRQLRLGRLQISHGAVIAGIAFGAFHLLNAFYQPWSFTLPQAGWATVFGIIIAYGYEKTQNIWGAVIIHNVSDLTFFILPFLLG